jgi:hypothetical protein
VFVMIYILLLLLLFSTHQTGERVSLTPATARKRALRFS